MARRIYNEELYEGKVNKQNKRLLEDYILEMKSKKKAKGTIDQYTADIKMFFCYMYLELDNKYILDLKYREFRDFFLEMQDDGASASRINRVQCSLRNMLEYASQDEDEYDYPRNIMSKIKGLPKEDVREIVFLSDEQVRVIIDHYLEVEDYQKALYIALSYESCGRRNEVKQVKKTGFLESVKTNQVVGKRSKKFNLLYFNKVKEIGEKWLSQRGDDGEDALFIATKGGIRQASYELLYSWCVDARRVLKEKTGEFLKFNPHSFRHSGLTNYEDGTHYVLVQLGKEKLDIQVLKLLANHENVDTTFSYLKDKSDEVLAEAFGI